MVTIQTLCENKENALENIVCEKLDFCLGLNVLRFVIFFLSNSCIAHSGLAFIQLAGYV